MINTNNQINPGKSWIDFSRIRKASSGMKIPKFQTSTTRNGINYIDGSTWQGNIFSGFQSELLKMLEEAKANGTIDTVVSNINAMQERYATLRAAHPNINSVSYDKAVQDYQKDIQEKYGFVNTAGVGGANGNDKRYHRLGTGDLGDPADRADASGSWANSADGLWGGKTQDRTLLGYGDDWTDENLTTGNDLFKKYNLKLQKGEDGAWRLAPITTPNPTDDGSSTVTPGGKTPSEDDSSTTQTNTKSDYTAVDYTPEFNFKPDPFLSPLYNAAIAGTNLYAAAKVNNLAKQKKVALQQSPYYQYEVTSGYADQQAYDRAAAQYRQQAQNSHTSSLEGNMLTDLAYNDKANEMELQGQIAKNDHTNTDIQKANQIGQTNIGNAVSTWNGNQQNLVANQNAILTADQQLAREVGAIDADLITKDIADKGNYKVQQQQNLDYAKDMYNQNLVARDQQELVKGITELEEDPTKSKAFKSIMERAQADAQDNSDALAAFKNIFWTEDGETANPEAAQKFYEYLTTNQDSDYYKDFTRAYNTEYQTAYNKYKNDMQTVNNRYNATWQNVPLQYSTQGFFNPKRPTVGTYRSVFSAKKGGTIKKEVTTKDRMLEYLEHNRKVEKAGIDTAMATGKALQDKLKRDLDALDRETLLLLRSIFK